MSFKEPAAVENAFYDAFRALDVDAMQNVWMDSLTVSCIHPGGELLQGYAAVIDSWADIFTGSEPPQVEYRLVQSNASDNLAVHTVEERVSTGSGARRAVVLATNIYGLVDGEWRMLAHHASLPLVEPRSESEAQPPLH